MSNKKRIDIYVTTSRSNYGNTETIYAFAAAFVKNDGSKAGLVYKKLPNVKGSDDAEQAAILKTLKHLESNYPNDKNTDYVLHTSSHRIGEKTRQLITGAEEIISDYKVRFKKFNRIKDVESEEYRKLEPPQQAIQKLFQKTNRIANSCAARESAAKYGVAMLDGREVDEPQASVILNEQYKNILALDLHKERDDL